jgi:hypothetical protein
MRTLKISNSGVIYIVKYVFQESLCIGTETEVVWRFVDVYFKRGCTVYTSKGLAYTRPAGEIFRVHLRGFLLP